MVAASKQHSLDTKITSLLQRVQWVTKLLVNPKFYDIIDNTIFQNASKLDSTLSTICYLSLFCSQVILLKPKLANWFPNFKLWRLTETEKTLSAKLRKISSYISDIRIFNRMWAAIPLMSWLLSTYYKIISRSSKEYSKFDKMIDFVEVTSCLLLQIFENVGFVGDHQFTTQSDKVSLWFNIWCCKLWAVYVVTDILKVITRDKVDRKALISNLANLPLTVHWSLPDGCLSPLQVGFFGTFSSCLNTLEYWKQVLEQIKGL